jgi:uncharacterized protein
VRPAMKTEIALVKDMRWLWAASAAVYEGDGFVLATRRIRFCARALAVYGSIKPIINAPQASPLGRLIERRPETVGCVIWPYQCVGWNARTRLDRIRDHYAVIEATGELLDFPVDSILRLLDLGEIRKGLSVVVEQPKWLMHEGQLSINLFLDELRIYSLVFSLFHHGDVIAAFVGGIQGRAVEGALDEYRKLTKAFHGMRPRDLLIEVFRMLCAELGVTRIFAVANQYRHHMDRYFSKASKRVSSDYNEIWADRGGVRVDTMFFQLDVHERKRNLATIGAKKRGMYRRRYEMLGRIKQQMDDNCRSLIASKTAFASMNHERYSEAA